MSEHLVKAGGNTAVEAGDNLSRIPHLHSWFRTTCAVVMHLTNGSVQVWNLIIFDNFIRSNRLFPFSDQLFRSLKNYIVSSHERSHLYR